jgi:hypothetical protein
VPVRWSERRLGRVPTWPARLASPPRLLSELVQPAVRIQCRPPAESH